MPYDYGLDNLRSKSQVSFLTGAIALFGYSEFINACSFIIRRYARFAIRTSAVYYDRDEQKLCAILNSMEEKKGLYLLMTAYTRCLTPTKLEEWKQLVSDTYDSMAVL